MYVFSFFYICAVACLTFSFGSVSDGRLWCAWNGKNQVFNHSFNRIDNVKQGGGGSPYSTYLICKELLCQGKTIRVVDHKNLPSNGYLARGGNVILYIAIKMDINLHRYHSFYGFTFCGC